MSSHVDDFNTLNKVLTAKLLKQGYRYHKLRKVFSKFYRRHFDLVSKYNVGLKALLLQGLSDPTFYGDLVYKFRKIIGNKRRGSSTKTRFSRSCRKHEFLTKKVKIYREAHFVLHLFYKSTKYH